eukprot:g16319.t1
MRSSKWLMNFLKGENQSGAAGAGEMNGEYACTKNAQYRVDETNAGFAEPGTTSEGNTFSPPADTEQEAKAGRLADPPQSAADGIFLPTEQKRHERLFEWDVHDEHNSRKKKIYQLNHADF